MEFKENNIIDIKLNVEDAVTMTELSEDGKERVRSWIKVSIDELKKASILKEWTEVNPREQNLKAKPAKAMKNTLTSDERDIFHFLNRGISISALECHIGDNKEVTITLGDTEKHGVFDGGHTFKVLQDALENAKLLGLKHVMLEVFTGVEDILFDLARSRNTSTQVKEKSLANLEGKFDFLKDALEKECFYNNIAWVENDEGDISINYIIQILTTFNQKLEHKSMLKTYSGAGSCETSYIKEYDKNISNEQKNNIFYKLTPLYSDIFRLVDHILVKFPSIYNKNGYESQRGNFGKLKGITYNQDHFSLLFTPNNKKTSYKIPNPLFFPILAAMRQLYVEGESGMYEWIIDPIKAFDDLSDKLVTKVMGCYIDKNGAVNEVGKSLGLWIDTYEIVAAYLAEFLKEQEILELKRKLAMLQL